MIKDLDTQKREFLEEAAKMRDEAVKVLFDDNADAEAKEKARKQFDDIQTRAQDFRKLNELDGAFAKLRESGELGKKGQDKDNPFETTGQFLRAVKAAYTPHIKTLDDRLIRYDDANDIEVKNLGSLIGEDGGFLVGSDMVSGIQQQIIHKSIVMPRANVIPMSGRTLEITRLDQQGTEADQPHQFGGMLAYWEGEAQTIRRTQPRFKRDTLTAYKLAAIVGVPNETLADAKADLSIESQLNGPNGFGGVLSYYMDLAFLRGTGQQQPEGVIDSPAAISVARQSATGVIYSDLGKIIEKSLPGTNYAWVAHVNSRGEFLQLQSSSQTDILLWGDPERNLPMSLLGYPILWTGIVPSLGSRGSLGLYDFGFYNIGQRQMITVDANMSVQWEEDMTLFKATARCDGQTAIDLPYTTYDGAGKISPFVVTSN